MPLTRRSTSMSRHRTARRETDSGRRGLQVVLTVLGAVATFEGARGVVQGVGQVVNGGPVSASVDSEYRFYSSWYCVLGLLLLGASRRPESETRLVRAGAGGFLLAACGRVLSIRSVGEPHRLQKVLMAVEFAIPVVLVPWQGRVARRARRRR
jgi:Domain of unknown function (DUF4345)